MSDTNAPPSVRSTVWVEQNVRSQRVLARRRPPTGSCSRSVTVRRQSAVVQALGGDLDRARRARCQRRTIAPARVPSACAGPRARSPRDGDRRGRPHTLIDRDRRRPDATSRSTASSQARWRSPPTSSSSTGSSPSPRRARRWRRTTCRKRTRDLDASRPARPRAGTRCASSRRRPDARALCAARIDAAERPALLVLERRAPVRPQDVALVEHGVGDRAHGVGHPPVSSSGPGTSSSSAASQLGERAPRLVGDEPVEASRGRAAARRCRGSGGPSSRARPRTGRRYSASRSHEMRRGLQHARPSAE